MPQRQKLPDILTSAEEKALVQIFSCRYDAGLRNKALVSLMLYAGLRYRSSGHNLRVVQLALGHSSIQTTEIYTHIANDEVGEEMRTLRQAA